MQLKLKLVNLTCRKKRVVLSKINSVGCMKEMEYDCESVAILTRQRVDELNQSDFQSIYLQQN